MHTKLTLDNAIQGVLKEIGKFGLCIELNHQYRRIYNRLKRFAKKRNIKYYSCSLIVKFVEDIKKKHETGKIGNSRRNHLKRAAFMLQNYAENGSIKWRVYVESSSPVLSSERFSHLYAHYLEDRKTSGWSENTLQSAKNLVRQFLFFLENNSCRNLSMATPKLISSFFQHLHATYSPGSIRTVASHIRSFLKSVEGGERFLCTVPSHCVRNKPIIQILSNLEHNALKKALQFSKISLRDKSIVLLALRTGLRAVDIVGLKLKDIDWIQETISVTQSKTGNSYKIPLPTDVGNLLSSYILDERPKTGSPYLFLRSLSPFRHLCGHSACYAVVRKLFRQAGIRLATERKGIHVIRHSVASQMLSKGVPVTTISSLLGHVDKRSTDVYLSTDEDRMRECCLDLTMISMNCERLK